MNFAYCFNQLSRNAVAIQHLIDGIDIDQARWKPDAEKWSILEVICHLADEEREDFRTRVRHVLSGAAGDPPPIDPANWVIERDYNHRDSPASLDDFLTERQNSLSWLKSLQNPNWDATYTASWGSISAGDLFTAWVAHDVLHLRQLVELKWAYNLTQFTPYDPHYAGHW
jgi:hypothetical protein